MTTLAATSKAAHEELDAARLAAEQAIAAAADANAAEVALEQRVIAGEAVGARELADAASATRLAGLQAVAASNKAGEAEQIAHDALLAKEQADAQKTLDRLLSDDALESARSAYADFVRAAIHLQETVAARLAEEVEIENAKAKGATHLLMHWNSHWSLKQIPADEPYHRVHWNDATPGLKWARLALHEASMDHQTRLEPMAPADGLVSSHKLGL